MATTEGSGDKRQLILFLSAYFMLGLLVGQLVGLSSDSIAKPLISTLFAFGGGSILVLLGRLKQDDRAPALLALLGVSTGCLVGVYLGLYVDTHHLLSPLSTTHEATHSDTQATHTGTQATGQFFYLHDAQAASAADMIDAQYRSKHITPTQAYDELYQLVKRGPTQ